MKIQEVDTRNRLFIRQFLELPFRLYASTPQWVPPLWIEARRWLDRDRNPFYQEGEAAFFLALDEYGEVQGRIAVLEHRRYNEFNRERTAFFYLLECQADRFLAQGLFKAVEDWATARGLDRLLGPKGFTPFDGLGLLVQGFEYRPAFGIPYNLPYYPELIEAAGFKRCGEMVSGCLNPQAPFPEGIHQIAGLLKERRGLSIARFRSRRDLRSLVPMLQSMYNAALSGGTGVYPLTDAEVKGLADQLLWLADPQLIKIVLKDKQPVGFLFAYPDVSAALQRTRGRLFPFGWLSLLWELRHTDWININGAGMIEGYRGLGGTALLFSEMQKSVAVSRYRHAEVVQIGVENERMLRELRGLGIDFNKVHRLYEKRIGDQESFG